MIDMPDVQDLSEEQIRFIRAYLANGGNISDAARRASVGRRTYYNWMELPRFRNAFEEGKSIFFDFIEEKLIELVRKGNTRAIIFCASTRLADRGYGLPPRSSICSCCGKQMRRTRAARASLN